MTKFDDYLNEVLNEYSSSMTKRTNIQKLRSSAGSIGTSLAKKQNDPLYKKMIYYKHLYLETKAKLQKKYKSKSMAMARKKSTSH
jgi:hypothetical protein